MERTTLLSPRFTGERFADGSLPLSLLRDLESLQAIILEISKAQYLAANPDRKRTPRGFGDKLELHLVGVEEGSFIANIALKPILAASVALFPSLGPDSTQLHAKAARDVLVQAIAAASASSETSFPELPSSVATCLDRLGRGLKEGESIIFGASGSSAAAELTPEIRRRLVRHYSTSRSYTAEIELIGIIIGVDREVRLKLVDSTEHLFVVSEEQIGDIQDVKVGDLRAEAAWARVRGVGSFDANDKLEKVIEVIAVEPLARNSARVQIESMTTLKDGWLDGYGSAPNKAALLHFARWYDTHLDESIPCPELYPTEEGGVSAEWLFGVYDVSLDIYLSEHTAYWHVLNLETDTDEERELTLTDLEDVQWLINKLAELSREAQDER